MTEFVELVSVATRRNISGRKVTLLFAPTKICLDFRPTPARTLLLSATCAVATERTVIATALGTVAILLPLHLIV